MNGLATGCFYGGMAGGAQAIYYRRIMMLPKTALPLGLLYGATMGASAFYRFDI